MTLPPPLTLPFWFQPSPPAFLPVIDRIILVIMGVFVLAGIVAYLAPMRMSFEKLTKRALGRAGNLLVGFGLTGLLLYLFMYERIIYLSMRMWWLVWAGVLIYMARRLALHVLREIPAIQKAKAEREQFEKWLPKKKA